MNERVCTDAGDFSWHYCKPDPSAIKQWLPNEGVMPAGYEGYVNVEHNNGHVTGGRSNQYFWGINGDPLSIKHYMIITKPEWLEE